MSKKFILPEIRTSAAMGGAAIATFICPIIEQVYPGSQSWVPLPENWKKNQVIIPIGLGTAAMAASLAIENKNAKGGLIMFGLVAALSGVGRGLSNKTTASFVQTQRLIAQQRQAAMRRPVPRPIVRMGGSGPFPADRSIQSKTIYRA